MIDNHNISSDNWDNEDPWIDSTNYIKKNEQSENFTSSEIAFSDREKSEESSYSSGFNNNLEEGIQDTSKQEEQVENESETESIGLIDSPGSLHRKHTRIINEINLQDNIRENLNKRIERITKTLGKGTETITREQALKEEQIELEQKINTVKLALENLEKQENFIQLRLKEFNSSIKRKSFDDQSDTFIKQAENQSPESLFKTNNPLLHTVFYAVTFFPNLSSYDFERVVTFLLEERTINIKVKSQVTTEQGETQNIEKLKEKSLVEIWKNNCTHTDGFLSNYYISSITLEDDSNVIDFDSPKLRENFKNYFQQKQPLYLLEQFKRAKFLLFDKEDKVAINAMSLSVEMAVSSPSVYGKEWLFEIVTLWASKVNPNTTTEFSSEQLIYRFLEEIKPQKKQWFFVIGRISSLIMQMLDSPKLKDRVVSVFFNNLIAKNLNNESDHNTALAIVKRLFSHPEFDGFYWLKQLLDRGEVEIKNNTYMFLYRKLNQNNLDSDDFNIYDFLESIKPWLPEYDLSPDRFSRSNRYALQLLPEYCDQSIKELDSKQYGKFPPQYSLFTPLLIRNPTDSYDSTIEKLDILFTWLLHPEITSVVEDLLVKNKNTNKKNTASKKIIASSPYYLMSKSIENKGISKVNSFVPLILAEWCIILWGLDKQEPEPEAIKLINALIQQIIVYAKITHQEYLKKRLVECWDLLIESLLNKAELSRKSGDRQLRKQYLHRRNIVKYLNKQLKIAKKQVI